MSISQNEEWEYVRLLIFRIIFCRFFVETNMPENLFIFMEQSNFATEVVSTFVNCEIF